MRKDNHTTKRHHGSLLRLYAAVADFALGVCLAMTATACTNEEEDEGAEDSGEEQSDVVDFVGVAGDGQPTSRAATSYVANSESFETGAAIGVFAYYTASESMGDGSGLLPNFMYNQQVVLEDDRLWHYAPLKYWPNEPGEKVSFAAYYPHGARGLTLSGNDEPGLPRMSFVVQSASRYQEDLMFSDVVPDVVHVPLPGEVASPGAATVSSRVLLHFHHALAKVVVKVVDEHGDLLPFEATLSGLNDRGNVTTTPADPFVWSNIACGGTVFTTDMHDTERQRVLLLLPQALAEPGSDSGTLRFHYSYKGSYYDSEVFALKDINQVTRWQPGTTYTYVYHVSISGNSLSVNVNPWYQAGMVFAN